MANYNHEILVNYLRDVYSMELLVRKIEDDIHSTREDIQCEQALVEKVESTPIPAEGNISPKKDITPYMIAGFLILFISFGFFTLPSIGAISGILGIGVSIILFSCAGSVSSDNTKMQEEEKEKIKENFQRDVEEYEHMLALANDCRSVLPSQIDDYNAAVSHLQEAKEKLQSVYSVNIIPNKYRSVYVAYYLYDYISSSHETDIDRVLQTMLLDQIIAKLDKIIAQQEEIILNQRMQLAKQDALLAQSKKQHEEQMKAISNLEENQQMQNDYLAMTEALPYLPIHMKAPNFGCSAFCTQGADGHTLMGRNYDFKNDTSAMLVYCTPKDGYASVAFAALDNINANTPDASMAKKLATLTAPFICLDGMNEKGVSIAVLTLDSDPTYQQTGKPMIATTLAIRLVLDRAATTAEAVELLSKYDMFASSGRDYHFYITDASGDGRVLEYDCNDPARPLTVTPSRSVTNFFVMYKDNVLPNQRNGVYGHGRERYDAIEEILDANAGSIDREIAWQALQAASQAPNPQDVTSNTQWSILYDNTALTAEAVIRRDWNTKTSYDLVSNVAVTDVG